MGPLELVIIALIGFLLLRRQFGPHWMRSRWRDHVQEMQSLAQEMQAFAEQQRPPSAQSAAAAQCPACGAPAGKSAQSWPNGDVRCEHCGGWFNRQSK